MKSLLAVALVFAFWLWVGFSEGGPFFWTFLSVPLYKSLNYFAKTQNKANNKLTFRGVVWVGENK